MNISKAARSSVRKIEKQIMHSPKEIAHILDDTGKQLIKVMGDKRGVTFSPETQREFTNRAKLNKITLLTHNHPIINFPLSLEDIIAGIRNKFIETRAIGPKGRIYLMELPKNFTDEAKKKGIKKCKQLHAALNWDEPVTLSEYNKKYRVLTKKLEKEIPGIKFRTLIG